MAEADQYKRWTVLIELVPVFFWFNRFWYTCYGDKYNSKRNKSREERGELLKRKKSPLYLTSITNMA